MENEKLTKNELKEKMMKKFDKGMVIAWAIRNLLIIMVVGVLLVIAVDVIIELGQSGGSNIIQTVTRVVNEFMVEFNYSNKSNTTFVMGLIFIIIICDNIGKVFKNSKEAETPFCDSNVRNIATISKFAWIYAIFCIDGFAGYEIVMATLISVIYYIFKYGCELQEQSDETL